MLPADWRFAILTTVQDIINLFRINLFHFPPFPPQPFAAAIQAGSVRGRTNATGAGTTVDIAAAGPCKLNGAGLGGHPSVFGTCVPLDLTTCQLLSTSQPQRPRERSDRCLPILGPIPLTPFLAVPLCLRDMRDLAASQTLSLARRGILGPARDRGAACAVREVSQQSPVLSVSLSILNPSLKSLSSLFCSRLGT